MRHLLLCLALVGCKSKPATVSQTRAPIVAPAPRAIPPPPAAAPEAPIQEIEFQVQVDPKDRKLFPEGYSPYVDLAKPEIAKIRNRDEIVLRERKIFLIIDYPLDKPVEIPLEASHSAGFSRAELVTAISRAYHRIYDEEEQSARQKTLPMDQRKGLINRNHTDGKYGIWGHDLGDLALHGADVFKRNGGIYLELEIDS